MFHPNTEHNYAKDQRDAADLDDAIENVSDISAFMQEVFTAINGVLSKHPSLAKMVDEVDLRDTVEIYLLEYFDKEISDRLSETDWVEAKDALSYDKTKG
jgi:hypothetical protein